MLKCTAAIERINENGSYRVLVTLVDENIVKTMDIYAMSEDEAAMQAIDETVAKYGGNGET